MAAIGFDVAPERIRPGLFKRVWTWFSGPMARELEPPATPEEDRDRADWQANQP